MENLFLIVVSAIWVMTISTEAENKEHRLDTVFLILYWVLLGSFIAIFKVSVLYLIPVLLIIVLLMYLIELEDTIYGYVYSNKIDSLSRYKRFIHKYFMGNVIYSDGWVNYPKTEKEKRY